ncbi:hypothetical protein BC30090_p1065 (plasmid) [Bacillus cereus]|nr:hypothetical protein BC30090_p1065 [Bacillus cereus]
MLSLFMEDFIFDYKGHKIRLTDRGELENGAKLKTGERMIFISQSLMDLYDDYQYEVIDELDIDTNFVFVKLRGENKGRPMTYGDVESLFKRLRKNGSGCSSSPISSHTCHIILSRDKGY